MTGKRSPLYNHEKDRTSWGLVAALWGIGLVAVALRVYRLDADSLNTDEISTYLGAIKPWWDCLTHRIYPLYYLLARAALQLGGGDVWLRIPSVAAGVLGVFALYGGVRSSHGRGPALAAALLLAVSAFHIQYSREARFYALAMLLAVMLVWSLYRALEDGGLLRWAVYVLTANLAFITHLSLAPFVAAITMAAFLVLPWAIREGREWQALRRYAALIVATTLTPLAIGALFWRSGGAWPSQLLKFHWPMPTVSAATEAVAVQDVAERYFLTPMQYLGFFREFVACTPYGDAPVIGILVGLGLLTLLGLLSCVRRAPALGALIVAGIVLTPAPFFFTSAGHWWEAKYFAAAWPLALWLCAAGMGVFAETLARPAKNGATHTALSAGALLLCLVLPAAPFYSGLTGLFGPRWTMSHSDWKGAASSMARTLEHDDLVYYLADFGEPAAALDRPLRFYLPRYVEDGDARLFATQPYVGRATGEDIKKTLRQSPFAAAWFFTHDPATVAADTVQLLQRLGAQRRDYGGLTVWALGRPTRNLFTLAGFEDESLQGIGPPAYWGNASEAFEGAHSLRVENREGRGTVSMGLPLSDDVSTLRNTRFRAWNSGVPAGWTLVDAASASLLRPPAPGAVQTPLVIAPGPAAVVLRQPITVGRAPGHTVTVNAKATVAPGAELRVTLRYRTAQDIARTLSIPADGASHAQTLDEAVPLDADPRSFVVEIERVASAAGDASLEEVNLQVQAPGETIDPLQPYTLSLMMRYWDVPLYGEMGSIGVMGTDANGETFTKPLIEFGDGADWRRLVFHFDPSKDFPNGARSLRLLVAMPPQGTLFLDNVQFEAGTRPTLFTAGTRIPHDEVIGP